MGIFDRVRGVSRRDFFRIAGTYGMSSTLLAAGTFGGAMTAATLAKAAETTYNTRFPMEPQPALELGAAGFNQQNLLIERAGCLEFARDLEERTDGEIRIEFICNNQICGQLSCVEKAQQGIIDLYAASTQNSAGGAPYLNVLDYAYMFRSRADQYYFMYSPESQRVLRDPFEKMHGLKFLFTHAELRGIQLGLSWEDRETVTSIEQLFGTKNRVTGTQLGRIAMNALNLNPVPVAWEETLDGLKQGLIDGAETWASAVAYANMSPVVSQCVDLRFFCGTEHTAMNAQSFDGLGGELQDAVMEASYLTQVHVQAANEAALVNTVGFSHPHQGPDTIFAQNNVRVAALSDAEIKKAEEMCSPEFQPQLWEQWRERINGWAGGIDTYQDIYNEVRTNPHTLAENVEPRRWWRG